MSARISPSITDQLLDFLHKRCAFLDPVRISAAAITIINTGFARVERPHCSIIGRNRRMSVSPVANRSFLHRDRKPSPTSEKTIYATLDSLALKRATLPLQLLPVGERIQPQISPKMIGKKSSLQVNGTNPSSKQHAKYLMVVPPSMKLEPRETHSKISKKIVHVHSTVVVHQDRKKCTAGLRKSACNSDNSDIDVPSIRFAREADADRKVSLRHKVCCEAENFVGNSKNNSHSSYGEYTVFLSSGSTRESPSDAYEEIEAAFGTAAERGNGAKEIHSGIQTVTRDEKEREEEELVKEEEEEEGKKGEGQASRSKKTFVKSKSINDLTSKGTLMGGTEKLAGGNTLTESFSEEKLAANLLFIHEPFAYAKKKKHFARNVLHFVPEYIAKSSNRREKGKSEHRNGSLSSPKALSVCPKAAGAIFNDSDMSRSLSREELKYLTISSPTNFVHVASATNPNLVSNENMARRNSERTVITHKEKCATLPLLVARNGNSMADNCTNVKSLNVATGGTISNFSSVVGKPKKDSATHKCNDGFNVSALKRELMSELEARTAKSLESCQQVKKNGSLVNACTVKTTNERERESTASLSRAELRANFSFLWGNRTITRLEDPQPDSSKTLPCKTRFEVCDEPNELYDDVGPLNLITSQDNYDDVAVGAEQRTSMRTDENHVGELSTIFKDSEDIYDDVIGPTGTGHGSFDKDASGHGDDGYLFVSNEYSSVDEKLDDVQENDQDVYDDVGLPSEEQVNSLYAGSASGSILESAWTNGKESEWEDLEDTSAVSISVPPFRRKDNLSIETQDVASRKKSGQKFLSRKTRIQRSKVLKKSPRSSWKPATGSPTFHVTVSLGCGSVLLVGRTEGIEEWKTESREDRTVQENSQRTQGLVQMRVIDLDEDVDTQETSCYVHEDNTSDDSTYESLHSFQPVDDFISTGSETETFDEPVNRVGCKNAEMERNTPPNRLVIGYAEAPTKPNPPPPLEVSLTRTLGKRIKMFRTTWSITKGSLGRMRRRTSVVDDRTCEGRNGSALSSNQENHSNLVNGGKYSSILGKAKHFRKTVTGPFSTFYLNDYGPNGSHHSASRTDAEPIYNNTREEPDHYSVLADQEPLYQFYAEAAARVALDSNSDGYKEVENKLPSPSTTDLAKPGHRTLWCQTPQVVKTGLLQRLNAEEKKVQEAKFEILTSEASYLNSLHVLRDEFLNDLLIDELLTSSEKEKLFGGIPAVLHASEQFLAELETLWRQEPMLHELSDLLLKYTNKCIDIYVPYCSNQVSIDAALKDLRTRKGPKFDETIVKIEGRGACQNLSLHSFLMLPMQRITRLPLLADAVLTKLPVECAGRSDWEKVLSSLNYVVTQCNEAARAAAQEIEIETLARKLEYSVTINPIILKGKHLIKSGPVVQLSARVDTEYKLTFGKRFNKTPLFLLLLTDHLLVAKYKSNTPDETYTVVDTCKRSLIALESVPEDSPFAGRNGMLLTLLENYAGHQVDYILTCESDTERQRWLEAVSPLKRGLIGETLYEVWDCPQVVALYCYPSNQPDELSLHPGDVINVFRKMPDGWYHGEKLLNGEQGWFPGNFTKEVASEHARAKNIKQRHRFITLSGNLLQRKTKHQSIAH